MEFPFDINHLFPERFSILDQTLVAGRKTAGMPHLQANIETVIDELGRASAKAQQLPASITSASKLQSQKHQLYLLKEGESKGGRGVVVGFLKVGYKKLFLLDRQGSHVEAEPLCVLDFYIAENLQRYGYGRELFDFMLQHKKLEPVLMAYDRPSPKFLSFLAKHYCLTPSVPQANNFVVFEGFFVNIAGSPSSPLPDQGMFSFFGPAEKGSPKKAGRRDQALLFNGERSGASGAAGSPLALCSASLPAAVGILPVLPLPERGVLPQQAPPPGRTSSCPWAQQGAEPPVPPPRALQGKTQQRAGWGGHLQPVQGAPEQRSSWIAAQTFPRSKPLSLPPLFASKKPLASSMYRGTQLGGAEEELRGLDSLQRAPRGMLVNQQRRLLERESPGGRGGWWCTAGESCHSAQWVKQEHRGTRPW
ncbi:alpha-tubulin N-acetyltransferase 1 isoform X1 [Pseudochaenichthys georgianus]|uniref:alpha-tubulin N-acetyltransferase 1 isoform X1 n=2 Tax=Pseudochaenichthys georgianus TaxID=52239 RepID=UPI00146F7BCB|nr:alpha-tubulin N-acetyltransferase 1 isoform X1 [Pseudochaenichthys georgianus]